MSEWHKLRFAQRHINMCSMALSKRVLTMTGRMSVFRAGGDQPRVHHRRRERYLEHWRLGRFKFLTGDDKSAGSSLMRLGYDTFYVPDAAINTVEHPPEKSFIQASRKLMYLVLQQQPAAMLRAQARRAAWAGSPCWCCSTSASRCGPACSAWWWRSSPASSTASPSCWCTCSGSASPAWC